MMKQPIHQNGIGRILCTRASKCSLATDSRGSYKHHQGSFTFNFLP